MTSRSATTEASNPPRRSRLLDVPLADIRPDAANRNLEGDADLLVTIRIDAHSSRGLYKFSAPAGTVLATAKAASRMGWASGRFRTYHPTGTSARLRHPGREA